MTAEEGAQIYPPIRSLSKKLDIVREWQDCMSPQKLVEDVCAVCAQMFPCGELSDIHPSSEILSVLRNEWLPADCRPKTYDIERYSGAILCHRGMHCLSDIAEIRICTTCRKALTGRTVQQPKDAIANFQYYGFDELPHDVRESIHAASALELMLVAACRATVVTHHYQTKGIRGGRVPEEASQRFNRGNVALLPQDPSALSNVLPPTQHDLRGAVCVVFAGGAFRPSADALQKFPLVLVSKSRVRCIIEWLISNNEWYMKEGITFSPENLASLVIGGDDVGVLQGIEITHLRDGDETADADVCVDWSTLASDLVTETVAYVDGDRSERLWHAMKAAALAHALNHKSFLVSRAGSELMNENSPTFLTAVFLHLDPWGIGNFNHPARQPDQRISFQRQLRNLLRQVDSPFTQDATFPFVCWNILQKRAASENSAFRISSARRHSLVNDVWEAEASIAMLAEKLEKNPRAKVDSVEERKALRLFRELNVICWSLPGSNGYKLCRRNEIRSLTRHLGTLAFFLTLNPHDMMNVLVAHYGGMDVSWWRQLGAYERAVFVASHPVAAAKAFDVIIRGFMDVVVKYNKGIGLFGKCNSYYATVEAQGRGTLHCHMLLWVENHPN
ncbi:hypothetical protein M404DRAFT_159992, partial [Pisolithus tinctorius Marx 270]